MERDYIQRKGVPAKRPAGRGSSGRSPYNRKKSGPPPFLLLLLALIVLVAAVALVMAFVRLGSRAKLREDEPEESFYSSDFADELSSDLLSSEPVSAAPVAAATPPPERTPSGTPEDAGGYLQIGSTGYGYYKFSETAANEYITAVCDLGSQLKGISTLYNIVVPTSLDVLLSDDYIDLHQISSTNQKKAIHYLYSSVNAINPSVKTVSAFDALKLHNNDYVFFRTDQHWTQLGAYYAYQEFCRVKGAAPTALDQFDTQDYKGFLGSFYNDSSSEDMEDDPDTVTAYFPPADASLAYTDSDGNTVSGWPVIVNGSDYDTSSLYYIFCAGNQPYEVITNHDLDDGSVCVVVRDSFGSVFVPFLVDHYQTIYVVDYRYYHGDVSQLAAEKGAQDVILLNSISMTRDEDSIQDLRDIS